MWRAWTKARSRSTPDESTGQGGTIQTDFLQRQRPARPDAKRFEQVQEHPLAMDKAGGNVGEDDDFDSFWLDREFSNSRGSTATPSVTNSGFNSLDRSRARPPSRASCDYKDQCAQLEEARQKLEEIWIEQLVLKSQQSSLVNLQKINEALKEEVVELRKEKEHLREGKEKLLVEHELLRRDYANCTEEKKELLKNYGMIQEIKDLVKKQESALGQISEQTKRIEVWVSGVDQGRGAISLRKVQLRPWAKGEVKKLKICLTIPGMDYRRSLCDILGIELSSNKAPADAQKVKVEKLLIDYISSQEYNKKKLEEALVKTGLIRIEIPLVEGQLEDWNKVKQSVITALLEIDTADLIWHMFKCSIVALCEMVHLLSKRSVQRLVEVIPIFGLPAISALTHIMDIHKYTEIVSQLKVVLGVDEADSTRGEVGSERGEVASLHELGSTFQVEHPVADQIRIDPDISVQNGATAVRRSSTDEKDAAQNGRLAATGDPSDHCGSESTEGACEVQVPKTFSLKVDTEGERLSQTGVEKKSSRKKRGKNGLSCLCGSRADS